MANSDVDIKEVQMLRLYNQKFDDFGNSFISNLRQVEDDLDEMLNEMEAMVRDIDNQMDIVKGRISYYEDAEMRCYRSKEVDYKWVRYYRDNKEHMLAFKAQLVNFTSEAHGYIQRSRPMINQIKERLSIFRKNLPLFFERGKLFVEKAEEHILSYKETVTPN